MQDALSGVLDLARDAPEPLHVQMSLQIKSAVLAGRLPAGTRMPSSRALSQKLGVSRNTVLAALDQLKSEGILEAARGSGTRVTPLSPAELERAEPVRRPAAERRHRLAAHWDTPLARFQPSPLDNPRPFLPGIPDLEAFPREIWGASLRRAARLADTATAGYTAMSGHPRFLRVLAQHLAETRGVVAEPEQIIVTSSARGAISLIVSALLSPGDEAAIEEPGFRSAKAIFSAAGARLVPIPVDGHGIDPARLPAGSRPRLIYTTPSHQYPTGAVMALSRRLALIELANVHDGYIIEDDYDSEFQYRGRPIAALQGLDRAGSVIYVGTFAKSLLPGLRVGFAVVPRGLVDGFTKIHRHTAQSVAPVMQLALADFIERGHYRSHVRRMKAVYARRLAVFAEGIARHSRGALEAAIPDGGLQTMVRSLQPMGDEELAMRLEAAGIGSRPLSEFHLQPDNASYRGVLMGFAAWQERDAEKACWCLDSKLSLRIR